MAKQTQPAQNDVMGTIAGVAVIAALTGVAANQFSQARANWHVGSIAKAEAVIKSAEALDSIAVLKAHAKAEAVKA